MGCKGCGERNKAAAKNREYMYLECPICGTTLHGPKKGMPKIGDTLICGVCFKKYQKAKKLEQGVKKPVKVKGGKQAPQAQKSIGETPSGL